MNPDQIENLIDVLKRSKGILEDQNCTYSASVCKMIDVELIILKGMQKGMISPIRDFLCQLRAEKDEEPYSNQLNFVKRAIILEYLTEQIEKLEAKQ